MSLPNTKSTIVVTESADLDAATSFIADSFQSEDLYQVRCILVQSCVEEKFIELLKPKLKPLNTQSLDESTKQRLTAQFSEFSRKGLSLIHYCGELESGIRSAIVKCPRSMIASEDLPIVSLEVFRTTKEGVSFIKSSSSVGLWCENISIAFEFINGLPIARQVWLNSSHGAIHPKIPFFNGQLVCDDLEVRAKSTADLPGFTVQVADNIQFQTTFRANTFQTIVIPFGETFAN